MTLINGGHLVCKYLKEIEGVEIAFGLSGGHIESILDGFTEYSIRAIDVRHEQAAVMMAHAWYVYTGKPGVAFLTAGPGFTNGITGIANAFMDNVPLVILCGRHPVRDDWKHALQEMPQVDVVKPITKWAATCYDIRRIPEYLSLAFSYAMEGRPGPVFLELPPDILNIKTDESSVPMPPPVKRNYMVCPDQNDLAEAAELINSAKKPFFLGGSGVGFSRCRDSLGAFIEKTGIPFQILNYGRGELPDNHPLSLSDMGNVGLNTAIAQSDLLIAAGIRFSWILQSGAIIPPSTKVLRIDIDPREINRNRVASTGLVGDAGSVFEQLVPLVDRGDYREWIDTLRAACRSLLDYEFRMKETASDPIHPIRLVARIQEFLGADAVYVGDGGDTAYFGLTGFSSVNRGGVIMGSAGLLGCLGTGIPFAMAARLAMPDKKVLLFNGDGSFGFNSMEFDTMVRHDIPVVCVVNNDCAWGMIKHSQELSIGKDRCSCADLGLRHYEKMVEGLGGHGELVKEEGDIVPALKRAFESGKPSCINVITDPTITSPATPLFYQSLKMEE
jgi:acetolactate synthase-1/2/3 large subunit